VPKLSFVVGLLEHRATDSFHGHVGITHDLALARHAVVLLDLAFVTQLSACMS
jgi:hypothetical protein